jgi:WhiB family redox-sensing transcriptional regulator
MGSQNGRQSEMPTATDLAERITLGATSEHLAKLYNVGNDYIRAQLSRAGYNADTGEPRTTDHHPYRTAVGDQNLAWQSAGACIGTDPEDWFDERNTAETIATCLACPIRQRCLDWAMDIEADAGRDYRYGIYGGLTSTQRHALAYGATA